MEVSTEEFVALQEYAASNEQPSQASDFERSEARFRSELWEELAQHCDFWVGTLGNGVCLLADASGDESGERTVIAMRFIAMTAGGRRITYFPIDPLNQCRSRPIAAIEQHGLSEPSCDELALADLMKLARLSNPVLGAVREMGSSQYAALSRGQNEHVRERLQ